MTKLLRTSRKYNSIYRSFAIPAYVLMTGLILIGARAVLAIFSSTFNQRGSAFFWLTIFFLYLLIFYFIVSALGKGIKRNDASYGIGSLAEEIVATKLAALGDSYHVIHDISKGLKKGNIDHIVVGPTGVFAIETKANKNFMYFYKDNIRNNTELGEKFVKQAARNAYWVHEQVKSALGMDRFVNGLVVRPFNKDLKIDMYCRSGVCVMDGDSVYDYIKNFKASLGKKEIDSIYRFLCELKRLHGIN